MAVKIKNSNGEWVIDQKAIQTSIVDLEGNFASENVEGALRELADKIKQLKPSFTIGTVTTLPAGSDATVTLSGTYPNLVLNFGIPGGSNSSSGGSGGSGSTGGGSTGGGTDTPVGDTLYMYYGRITAEEAGVTNHYIEFNEITSDMILNARNVTKTKASTMNKKSFGLEEETRECDYLIVAVPKEKKYRVTKDNGLGGKVPFDEENVTGSSIGLDIIIDGKNYLLYGECIMSPCEIFFYID